jgi:endo-1,4-beta-D-glucanase Y
MMIKLLYPVRMSFFYLSIALFIFVDACSGNDDSSEKPIQKNTTTIRITVIGGNGEKKSGVKVYLFQSPATQSDGADPAKALKEIVSDENGIATFRIESLTQLQPGQTTYFTGIEKSFTGTSLVIGTIELTLAADQETMEKELVVSGANPVYEHGYLPTTISQSLVVDEYNRWKKTMVVPCQSGLRVIADPANETRVEAIGFGMLLAAYANDKETFDGIHTFYNSKRTPQAKNLMAWKVTCDGIADPGSATDGDVDVAFALIVASKQWEGTYLQDAKDILQIIKDNLILSCNVSGQEVLILGPGYSGVAWGGCGMLDIMYHTPAFFRVFANVTADNTWNRLAEDTYKTLKASSNSSTGLIPDWQTANGSPGPNGQVGYFGYDACRAPWRITLDYLWNGNEQAEAWAKKISVWSSSVGPANIVDGYEMNGTPRGTNGLNSSFLGGFSVAAMANDQNIANQFGQQLSSLKDTYWFNLNTRCLYLFTLSGNFWDPLKK